MVDLPKEDTTETRESAKKVRLEGDGRLHPVWVGRRLEDCSAWHCLVSGVCEVVELTIGMRIIKVKKEWVDVLVESVWCKKRGGGSKLV